MGKRVGERKEDKEKNLFVTTICHSIQETIAMMVYWNYFSCTKDNKNPNMRSQECKTF